MTNRIFGLNAAKRYLTLKTHKIHALPIAILMPHSGCNCRCLMCDIWKGNDNVQRLEEEDVSQLLASFKQLGTQWVTMSGGEAFMNPNLFRLCDMLREAGMRVTILSTGLLLKRYAQQVITHTDEVIVSLDGSEDVHNTIRGIPKAYQKLCEGVQAIKEIQPTFPISARCVIQQANFTDWPNIIDAAHNIGLDQISFLTADVSTEAFNRPNGWDGDRSVDVQLKANQLPQFKAIIDALITDYAADFDNGFIAESREKIERFYDYYAAFHDQAKFPPVRCNAPWVSTVIEADGTVRPCFFHDAIGNIREAPLEDLINSPEAIAFRQSLNMDTDDICRKCVCSLNLRPTVKIL